MILNIFLDARTYGGAESTRYSDLRQMATVAKIVIIEALR